MYLVLFVIEDYDVLRLSCGEDKALLIRVGAIARDGNKGLRDDGGGVFHSLGSKKLFVCALFQIFDGVRHFLFYHIREDKFVSAIYVHDHGVAVRRGIIPAAVALVQFIPRLRVEGLGRSCKGAARRVRGDGRAVLQLILDGVFLQRVGAPLGVQVKVTIDGHGEVKGLFRAVLLIEPTDKDIIASGGRCRGLRLAAVGHGLLVAVTDVDGIFHVNRQPCCDRVGHGNPLCVEDKVGGRHYHGAQIRLRACIAARRGIPSAELVRIGFKIIWVTRCEIVVAKRRLILDAAALAVHKRIDVVEAQIVAVARVAEVIFCLYSGR